jgi:hypothetical protein
MRSIIREGDLRFAWLGSRSEKLAQPMLQNLAG